MAFVQRVHPFRQRNVDAGNRILIQRLFQKLSRVFFGHVDDIHRHGRNLISGFEFFADFQRLFAVRRPAVQNDDERFSLILHFFEDLSFGRIEIQPRKIVHRSVRKDDDSQRRMIFDDFLRSDFRRFIERNRVAEPRRFHHSHLPVFEIAVAGIDDIADAIDHADVDAQRIVDRYGDRVRGNEFRFDRRNRFSLSGQRQFVFRPLFIVLILNLIQNDHFHEPFDKTRFSYSDRSHDT